MPTARRTPLPSGLRPAPAPANILSGPPETTRERAQTPEALRRTRPLVEGPPLLPAAAAPKGPHLQAFRQPGNPSTVRAVTVKAHKGQEAGAQDTWPATQSSASAQARGSPRAPSVKWKSGLWSACPRLRGSTARGAAPPPQPLGVKVRVEHTCLDLPRLSSDEVLRLHRRQREPGQGALQSDRCPGGQGRGHPVAGTGQRGAGGGNLAARPRRPVDEIGRAHV